MNPDKVGLLRLTCVTGTDRNGNPIFLRIKIADGNQAEGIPFGTINTKWGESLIDFHHRHLLACFPEISPIDESSWLHARGATPKEFYPAFLARCLCHGILFENYIDKTRETRFLRDVVLPAFATVTSIFGTKPLIVPLLSENTSDDPSWTWYEGHVAQALSELVPDLGLPGRSQ